VDGTNVRALWAALLAATLCPSFSASAEVEPPPDFEVRIRHKATAGTVRRALRGAAERLESPGCQAVFSDFSDASGRALSERLAELGETPRGYLGKVLFYDGSIKDRCQAPDQTVLAIAAPSRPVVFVCARAFQKQYRNDPLYAEATLIHETLHTLGLGENPPKSREITSQVVKRCIR
jgi:hypothetical protein